MLVYKDNKKAKRVHNNTYICIERATILLYNKKLSNKNVCNIEHNYLVNFEKTLFSISWVKKATH